MGRSITTGSCERLEARGHHFRTNSDTETIVHAYEEYGDECVKHLRGMFVFALWDRKRNACWLPVTASARSPSITTGMERD